MLTFTALHTTWAVSTNDADFLSLVYTKFPMCNKEFPVYIEQKRKCAAYDSFYPT